MVRQGGFYMDLEQTAQKLLAGKDTAALRKLTESEAAARLAASFDGAAVERAARAGDGAALAALMQSLLGTPEGRRFAREVREAADGHGR